MSTFDTPKGCNCGECKRCKNRLRAARWREQNPDKVAKYNYDPEVVERKKATSKAWKQRNPERCREYNKTARAKELKNELNRRYRQDARFREKITAREKARRAVCQGRLKKLPCENCGSEERVEGHHEDYSKPYEVTWLCNPCHRGLHGYGPRAQDFESARQESNLRPSA